MPKVIKAGNIRKTIHYLKKNGIKATYYAAKERSEQLLTENYSFIPPTEEQLMRQRKESADWKIRFSILVPLYETKESYLREMIDSCLSQSYGNFELILADASSSDRVENVVKSYSDSRILYKRLAGNGGISANTNRALMYATGDYAALLDHDDCLTEDALYEMAAKIQSAEEAGEELLMLYSDEDKCNGEKTRFYDPNRKEEFNLDLILSNNYICHFLVIKRQMMQELQLRSVYDGAQDYDLVLRVVNQLLGRDKRRAYVETLPVAHVNKVLYHWRCHEASTAENPESKRYAYDAGKRAVENFLRLREWKGTVSHLKHLGFYRVNYENGIFENRPDVAVVGGKIINRKNIITGGIYDRNMNPLYAGLHREYSGRMHRAVLQQEAEVIDIRCMQVSEEGEKLMEKLTGLPYMKNPKTGCFDWRCLKDDVDYLELSRTFCEEIRKKKKRIVWNPEMTEKI